MVTEPDRVGLDALDEGLFVVEGEGGYGSILSQWSAVRR